MKKRSKNYVLAELNNSRLRTILPKNIGGVLGRSLKFENRVKCITKIHLETSLLNGVDTCSWIIHTHKTGPLSPTKEINQPSLANVIHHVNFAIRRAKSHIKEGLSIAVHFETNSARYLVVLTYLGIIDHVKSPIWAAKWGNRIEIYQYDSTRD